MAILHLVRCDDCGKDTPMESRVNAISWQGTGQTYPSTDYVVPAKIKQIDGQHFCSWACVARYAEQQQGAGR